MTTAKGEQFHVRCPKCRRSVKVSPEEADRAMKVKCPCGEEIPLAKMV
jgi:NAD-dependent SIR2 family protein deacetylase